MPSDKAITMTIKYILSVTALIAVNGCGYISPSYVVVKNESERNIILNKVSFSTKVVKIDKTIPYKGQIKVTAKPSEDGTIRVVYTKNGESINEEFDYVTDGITTRCILRIKKERADNTVICN